MKYYAIVEVDITDPGWVPEYAKNVTRLVEQRGGRYLTRTSAIEKIEGQRKAPQIVVLVNHGPSYIRSGEPGWPDDEHNSGKCPSDGHHKSTPAWCSLYRIIGIANIETISRDVVQHLKR